MSMINIPASPHEELPILNTDEESGDRKTDDARVTLWTDEAVLMATISPTSTAGNTSPPELHLVSPFPRPVYNGESTTAETMAKTIATPLCEELLCAYES